MGPKFENGWGNFIDDLNNVWQDGIDKNLKAIFPSFKIESRCDSNNVLNLENFQKFHQYAYLQNTKWEFIVFRVIMDILNALVENVQNLSENMLSGINLTQPTEEQRISCIVSNFYKKICTRENIQNLLTKYQLQLFQIKEVNNETIRYANICSTRMGRVQQTLSEYAEQMNKLEQQFRPNNLNNWNVEIVQMGKEMNELEKQILQTELFIFELERIKEKKNNNIKKGINENIEDMTK